MANTQPTVDEQEADKELEALKGKVPGLEEALEPKQPPKEEAPAKEDPKPKEEEPEKEPESDEKEEEEEPQKPSRPEKYIPIKQYTSEKREWNESKAQFETRIAALETIAGGKEGSKKTQEAIKAYAEKYDADEDQIRELATILGREDKPAPKEEATISPEDQEVIDQSREIVAEKMFNEEFDTLALPELQAKFPSATPSQLAKAKKEVERLATTKEYLDKSLDFVVYKNPKAFDSIFSGDRKGPESARQAPEKGKSSFTATDFTGGKTPFSTLAELSVEDQTKIVETMDLKTYEKYTNWINQNDVLVINRGGRKLS